MDKRYYLSKKTLTQKSDIDTILAITEKDVSKELFIGYFVDTSEGKSKYKPWDEFTLPANALFNKTAVTTTIGTYIYNKFVYHSFLPVIGYQNLEFDNDNIQKVDKQLSTLTIQGKFTEDQFIDYNDRINWFGYVAASLFSTSLGFDVFAPLPKVEKRKEELLNKHSMELQSGDAFTNAKIEDELLKLSKDELKGHAAMDNFNNGVGKFGNAYKNMSIMRGSINDLKNPGKYTIVPESYVEGFSKENFPYFVNMNINGAYSKAVGTRVGGYETKKFFSSFQTVVLDDAGTDCGTKVYMKLKITPEIKDWVMYRYIKEGTKEITINPDNFSSYIGKEVQMRSPLFCQSEKICSKCAGEYFYMMGIKNVGLLLTKAPNTILMIEMKAFHDQTIKLNKLKWDSYILN